MKILITGCAGFIGSKLCERYIQLGALVDGIDDFSTGSAQNVNEKINFYNFDLSDPKKLNKLNKRYDYILHLAGQSSGQISNEDPLNDLIRNTNTTVNLISYIRRNKTRKFVYASSMSVYGNISQPAVESSCIMPISFYGLSKRTSEIYLNKISNEVDTLSLRMFNVYGPGQDMKNMKQGMVSIFLSQAIEQKLINVKGSLDRFRDFIYIDDAVDYWIKLTEEKKAVGEVNLATGKKTTIAELLQVIKHVTGVDQVKILDGTPDDQHGIVASTQKLNDLAKGLEITPIELGVQKFFNWAKSK